MCLFIDFKNMMRESVIYQEILAEGERSLILRQLTRRVGELPHTSARTD